MSFFYITSMLPTTTAEGWVCSALCQWSMGEAPSPTTGRGAKHTLSSKCEPRVNFCWFLVGFRVGRVEKWSGVETNSGVRRDVWPSLKQSHKSADWHGEREGARESGRQEKRGTQRNPKMRQQQHNIKNIEPHPRTDYYCVIFFPLFFSVISVKVDKEQPPRWYFLIHTYMIFVILMLFGHFNRWAEHNKAHFSYK